MIDYCSSLISKRILENMITYNEKKLWIKQARFLLYRRIFLSLFSYLKYVYYWSKHMYFIIFNILPLEYSVKIIETPVMRFYYYFKINMCVEININM